MRGRERTDRRHQQKPGRALLGRRAQQLAKLEAGRIRQVAVDQDHVDFFNIVDAVQSSGALAFTRQQAELEASAARQAISLLPAGEAQLALLALTEYATERSH